MASTSIEQRVKKLRDTLLSKPSGALEKLAAELVSEAAELTVRVASSGAQAGGDAGTQKPHPAIRIEAKRYGDGSALRERELLGEVTQAIRRDSDLDLWILVTTRAVPEQTAAALVDYGTEQGIPILILDWTGVFPQFAKLCAACPNLLASTVGSEAQAAAQDLASENGVSMAIAGFRAELNFWSAGWAMTAGLCHQSMHEILTSPAESRAFFRQDLAIAAADRRLVARDSVSNSLDDWQHSAIDGSPMFVLGEEGRGKSWALAVWLYALSEPNTTILYCSAAEFRALDQDTFEDALALALWYRSGVQTKRYWGKRIERLKDASEPTKPYLWLVIDGLNESPSVDWPGIFLHAQRGIWMNRVRLGATCRSRYFADLLGSGVSWTYPPTLVKVASFSAAERDAALRLLDIDPSQLTDEVLKLARVPRICRLVARLAVQLEGVEQVTYEHLLFEYGKRFDPEARSGLTTDAWLAFLRELATTVHDGMKTIKHSELRQWIDVGEINAIEAALSDIVDGQLVRPVKGSPGIYEFDRDLVLAANGLALWKLLDTASESSETAIADLLSQELEPLDGLDDRARIIRAAFAAAVLSGSASAAMVTIAVSLLKEGMTAQNVSESDLHSLMSHVEAAPDVYIQAIDALARNDKHSEAAAISTTLRAKAKNPLVHTAVVSAATDWIRLVGLGITGKEGQRDSDQRREQQIIRWLGTVPSPGEKEIVGVPLVFESGYSGHHLALYALQFIQSAELEQTREFWRRFALANVLSAGHNVSESASWVVRLNRFDFGATRKMLSELAIDLATVAAPAGSSDSLPRRAAAKLLWLSGDERADKKAREYLPEPDGWAGAKNEFENPRNSFFQLNRCQVEDALEGSSQPVQRLLERARNWWADPSVEIPSAFRVRAEEYLDSFDLSDVRSGFSRSRGDHNLEAALPGFSRCFDSSMPRFIARLVAELPSRTGAEWASLAIGLAKYWLVLSSDDRAIALRELKRKDIDEVDDERLGYARSALRSIAYPPQDRLGFIRALIRAQVDTMSAQLTSTFGALSDDELRHLLAEVKSINEPYADWILINLLANTETTITDEAAEYLLTCTRSKLPGIRLHALFVLAAANCSSVATDFAATNWTWQAVENDAERRHGSEILLSIVPPLPIADVLSRVAPWRLPKAAYMRGPGTEAALIAKTITGFLQAHGEPPRHLFDEVTNLVKTRFTDPLGKLSLEEPADWNELNHDLEKVFDTKARLDELQLAEREALSSIAAHRKTGRAFYGEWVRPKHLEALLVAAPDELNRWLQGVNESDKSFALRIRNAAGFYISLCRLLLSKDPEVGIKLWRAIDSTPHLTQFIGDAGINWQLLIAFETEETVDSRSLWDELWDIPRTRTDLDLFQIVLAAELGGRREWLDDSIKRDMASALPWHHFRAAFASSFRISPDLDRAVLNNPPGLYSSLQQAKQQAAEIAARGVWQHHWLKQFATVQSDREAFASFTIFLTQADRRWTLIVDRLQRDGFVISDERMRFLRMRQADIERKSKKLDDGLRKVFLGRRTVTTVWPWLHEA